MATGAKAGEDGSHRVCLKIANQAHNTDRLIQNTATSIHSVYVSF